MQCEATYRDKNLRRKVGVRDGYYTNIKLQQETAGFVTGVVMPAPESHLLGNRYQITAVLMNPNITCTSLVFIYPLLFLATKVIVVWSHESCPCVCERDSPVT